MARLKGVLSERENALKAATEEFEKMNNTQKQ